MRFTCALMVPLFVALGCTSSTDVEDDDEQTGVDPKPTTVFVGVDGVAVQEVSVYQGVKRVLAQGGQAVGSNVPLVAGRDALVRVFYTATDVGRAVKGRLELEGGDPIDVDAQLVAASAEADYASTINFIVPGDRVGQMFNYRVSIGEVSKDLDAPDHAGAHYPAKGLESHAVEGPVNTLRVILAPFRYDADGSGRLPDLSPERVEQYRTRLLQLYPVSNVEISVREPTPWGQPIYPNGGGWEQVGLTTFGFRGQDGASPDVYYYAVFNPTATMYQFCAGGCLLGVTLLNDQPADVGNPQLRIAMGVGFDETATGTAAHELGHAHGRPHAPCGFGLAPDSIDPQYPYPEGAIGVWGWDIVSRSLIDPAVYSDIMGYCDTQWISDYNYAKLLMRGKNVNLPMYHPPMGRNYELITVDEHGVAEWRGSAPAEEFTGSVPVDVTVEGGGVDRVAGGFYRYDHMPGGWLLVPTPARKPLRFEAIIGERRLAVNVPH
jgi:hypothetical protein